MKTLFCGSCLGDSIILSGAAVYLAEKYGEFRYVCAEQFETSVRSFFEGTKVQVETIERIGKHGLSKEDILTVGSLAYKKCPPRLNRESWLEWYYRQLDVPFSVRFTHCPIAEAAKKVAQVELPSDVALVHDDVDRDFNISDAKYPRYPIRIHRVEQTYESVLCYARALETAPEVHCIDSCFIHLADSLQTTGKLYWHRYARYYDDVWHDVPHPREWIVIDDPEMSFDVKLKYLLMYESLKPKAGSSLELDTYSTYVTKDGWKVIKGDLYRSLSVEQSGRLDWEREMILFTEPYIKEGDFVIDVGANIGDTTISYIGFVGSTGEVIAYEPHPVIFECLDYNCPLSFNFQLALSDEKKTMQIKANTPDDFGTSYLTKDGEFGVECVPLDEHRLTWAQELRERRVNFIKIDVEGAEPEVLRGARELIQRDHPTLLVEVFDSNLERLGHTKKELRDLLEEFGYTKFYFSSHLTNWDDLCFNVICQ